MSASPQSSATLPTPTTTVLISHTQFIDRNLNLILPKIISLLPAPNNARFFYRAGVLCEIIENDHDLTTFKFITTNLSQRKIGIAINEIWEAKLKRTYEDQRDLQEVCDLSGLSSISDADFTLYDYARKRTRSLNQLVKGPIFPFSCYFTQYRGCSVRSVSLNQLHCGMMSPEPSWRGTLRLWHPVSHITTALLWPAVSDGLLASIYC